MVLSFDSNALYYAACGGLILGAACSLNYIIRGKDTGMTRIAYNFATFNKPEIPQMSAMLGGMFIVSSLFYLIYGNGNHNGFQPFGPDKQITQWTTLPGFLIAGLFTGFGAKFGGGCTSGHGLCGLPRISLRSFVAVCMFLLAGFGVCTVANKYGINPFVTSTKIDIYPINHHNSAKIILIIGVMLPIVGLYLLKKWKKQQLKMSKILDHILVCIIGGLFATGLLVSGMSRRINVLQFLELNQNWNPALLLVLGCGVGMNLITFSIMKKRGVSLNGNKVFNPVQKDNSIDWRVLVGGFSFGIGWGLAGICPGPFYVLFSVFTIPIQILWAGGFIIGVVLGGKLFEKTQPSAYSYYQHRLQKIKQTLNLKKD